MYHYLTGKPPEGYTLCPLFADLDRLLPYLDEIGLTPGHAIDQCPECGGEHRWAFIKALMIELLPLREGDGRPSRLLDMVDANLAPVRALYGGEAGFQSMRAGAEKFFHDLAIRQAQPPKPRRVYTRPQWSEKTREQIEKLLDDNGA